MEIEVYSELPQSRWCPPPPDLSGRYGGFRPSFSCHTRATCLFTLPAILLGTGQRTPKPIVAVLDAGAPLAVRRH
ncbi:hypothetical protein [Azospirillum humicireducens]|uniref:hypothetical protein n=1 Tax=Azospirillum humicireducens TaxID=1226968 RepID=UPI0011B26087|nr:hypothetical protein [Azospirillum humicireducens]